jgi:hypothetical protein
MPAAFKVATIRSALFMNSYSAATALARVSTSAGVA